MSEAQHRPAGVVTPEPPSDPPPITAQEKEEKGRFRLFARMLMRHLERVDASMYAAVKATFYECFANRDTFASLKAQLRATVGEHYWEKTRDDLDHFLKVMAALEPRQGDARDVRDPRARTRHLLLLHHASICAAEDGRCTEPDCAATKVLWKHLAGCQDPRCTVPLCLASRSLLSHYRRCRAPCRMCDPVREMARNEAGRKAKRPRLAPPGAPPPRPASPAGTGPLGGPAAAAAPENNQRAASPAIAQSCSKNAATMSSGRTTSTTARRLPPKKRSFLAD